MGTALKPAHEPIIMARKPLIGTVAANVMAHGTGALNIDATRIATTDTWAESTRGASDSIGTFKTGERTTQQHAAGRWPSNVLLDEHAAAELDEQSGERRPGERPAKRSASSSVAFGNTLGTSGERQVLDSGGASRFFFVARGTTSESTSQTSELGEGDYAPFRYVAKPSRAERDLGCGHLPERTGGEATDRVDGSAGTLNPRAGAGRGGGVRNFHPTVKPVTLMRYLVRLVTPPGGTVLDPFCGSGTTGIAARLEGRDFLGIEREPDFVEIATARISAAKVKP